jgi:ribulose-5-phosphate 4-epimerase/fuculose-1-phosphate aldolase
VNETRPAPPAETQAEGGVRPRSTASLQELINELVAANRILFKQGVVDAYGHVSTRHPHNPDTFLISSGRAPGLVSPEHIVELDLDGREIRGTRQSLYLERFIHSEIYRARPDVGAVVHSHSPSVVPFSVVPGASLRPICHMSGFLHAQVPVFEIRDTAGTGTDLLVSTPLLGQALAQRLGSSSVVLMRGHGSTVIGRTLREAVFHAVYTEVNARLQREALALGSPVFLTAEEASACVASVSASADRAWSLWLGQI